MRVRKKKQETARQAVSGLLDKLGFEPEKYGVFDVWDKEVRPFIRGCEAVALQGSRLCVRVPSAVHRQELLAMKDRILKRVNHTFGRRLVTDVRFELDKGGSNFGKEPNRPWNGRFGKGHG